MRNITFSKSKVIAEGVSQKEFSVEVKGESVPCVIWMPEPDKHEPTVLIAMAHGGSQHKKTQSLRTRAAHFAKTYGWITLAIDAPDHGSRISREEAELKVKETRARVNGDKSVPSMSVSDKIEFLDSLASQAVPEWQAALDAVLASTIFEQTPAIGFWGLSMGSTIGIPLLAADKRFTCAVLGLAELHPQHQMFREAAASVSIPLRFVFQWDDLIRNRKHGVELYSTFSSQEKSMHINPGGHNDFPDSEQDSWETFFLRYLK